MRIVIAVLVVAMLPAGIVDAHIHLTNPRARTDSLTGDQKDQHCGVAGQVRNPSRVTTYRPGETITVTWMETVEHPGHFRIALQPNGDTFGIPPPGNGPPAGFPSLDQTGMTDSTGALILKDFIPDETLSTQITFPMMECNNCTLQFIQVMTDKPPYTIDTLSDDIYFNCADITLSNTAPQQPDGGIGPGGDAGVDPADPEGGGCCSSGRGSAATGLLGGLVVGLILRRRRRR
jgi:MYXO-CTERM domain-containing protein